MDQYCFLHPRSSYTTKSRPSGSLHDCDGVVVSRYSVVFWSSYYGQGSLFELLDWLKVFRGTGGICQLARNEEFPNVFTSAVCRSSGGAWNGGHDLVWPLLINCLTLIEWTYFYTYSCVVVSVVGIVTTPFLSDVSLFYCYQGFCKVNDVTDNRWILRFLRFGGSPSSTQQHISIPS